MTSPNGLTSRRRSGLGLQATVGSKLTIRPDVANLAQTRAAMISDMAAAEASNVTSAP